MSNPHVDIISHPTGRILKRREEYEVVFDDLVNAARETGTILEINSYPDRLDLGDVNILAARQLGVRMVINSDAHRVSQLPPGQLRHLPGPPRLGRKQGHHQRLAGGGVVESDEVIFGGIFPVWQIS